MKQIVTFLLAVLATFAVVAQTPTLSYQAVVRDGSNKLVLETAITAAVNLYNGSEVSPAYSETHSINSDRNGLINLAIGSGGTSHSGDFNAVDWSQAQIAITLSWNGGANTATLPRTTFTVVPTAIYSHTTNYANLPKTETITNNDHTKLVTEGAVKDYVDGQIGSLTNYAELAGDNTFTGNNDFTGGTIIVPTNLSDPIVFPATCTNAANLCDLIAVFDSLKNSIDTLNNQLNRQLDALTDSLQALRDTLDSITHPVITPIITFNEDLIDGIVTIASAEHADTIKIYDGSNNLVATIEPVNVGDVISTGLTEGDYTVITTNTTGGSTTTTITVHITTYTLTLSPASSTQNICAGGSTNITYTVSSGSEPYKWFVNGTEKAGETASTLVLTFNSAGSTEIKVTGHNCDTPKVTQTIAIAPDPIIGICEEEHNATVTLKSMDNTTKIEIYDLSDVLQKTISSPTVGDMIVTTGELPDGTYTLIASNANNCTSTRTATVGHVATYCTGTPNGTNETGSGKIEAVQDHEGNSYEVVQIGSQCWMRENMRATTFVRMGGNIPVQTSVAPYTPSIYKPDAKYGVLYNWAAAIDTSEYMAVVVANYTDADRHRGICPFGWHLPTDVEWKQLEVFSGMGVSESDQMDVPRGITAGKFTSSCMWNTSTTPVAPGDYSNEQRNTLQFYALPVGFFNGSYLSEGSYAAFWSATQHNEQHTYHRTIKNDNAGIYRASHYKNACCSVRCVRD